MVNKRTIGTNNNYELLTMLINFHEHVIKMLKKSSEASAWGDVMERGVCVRVCVMYALIWDTYCVNKDVPFASYTTSSSSYW